ncbi:hypothetical protein OOU_Y34scaffold00855g1 [Pyricularia oryzae Y34]|uniref:Uncharacterized protein n=1 Tax=Pyricularia oryzae (strain Y34) TaxID=1143189 RepID=A0AA97PGN6_PYRO3|nr:hypothetical protein OOU_Y34scaffold00855g1 [Pyricularia oryzae Y34]
MLDGWDIRATDVLLLVVVWVERC